MPNQIDTSLFNEEELSDADLMVVVGGNETVPPVEIDAKVKEQVKANFQQTYLQQIVDMVFPGYSLDGSDPPPSK